MLSITPWKRLRHPQNGAVLLALVTMSLLSSWPARAVTCEDVRGLSKAQQEYWSKRLNLSSEQRRQIWLACYKDYRPNRPIEVVRR